MKRPVRRILTPALRKHIENEIRDKEIQLHYPTLQAGSGGRIGWTPMQVDQQNAGATAQDVRRLKQILEQGSAHDLTKAEVRERDKEIARLEGRVRKKLVPHEHYHLKSEDSKDYNKVVRALVTQADDKELGSDIERLKNLKRERDPENPDAGNIEYLRTDSAKGA